MSIPCMESNACIKGPKAAQILLTDKAAVSEKYLAELSPHTQTEELTPNLRGLVWGGVCISSCALQINSTDHLCNLEKNTRFPWGALRHSKIYFKREYSPALKIHSVFTYQWSPPCHSTASHLAAHTNKASSGDNDVVSAALENSRAQMQAFPAWERSKREEADSPLGTGTAPDLVRSTASPQSVLSRHPVKSALN
ncbi:hypothetical protein EK904_005668 [Melospiza melodia maxima]|nr:hypothetical protein EK904_005668 [Melospiza melodia maxima]